MTTQETAQRLAELCRKAEWEIAVRELFADDAVSIEPYASPAFDKETRGIENIVKKGKKFDEMVEIMHTLEVSEPLVASNSIAMAMRMDVTMKDKNKMDMTELCVYKLKDGKIISEEFFM